MKLQVVGLLEGNRQPVLIAIALKTEALIGRDLLQQSPAGPIRPQGSVQWPWGDLHHLDLKADRLEQLLQHPSGLERPGINRNSGADGRVNGGVVNSSLLKVLTISLEPLFDKQVKTRRE